MKIRTKVNLSFFPTFVVILLAIGVSIYFYFSGQIKQQAEAYLFSSAKARAEHVRTFLQNEMVVAKIMAASTVYRDLLKEPADSSQYQDLRNRVEKRLQRTLESEDNLINLHILDRNGQIIASSNLAEEGKDKSSESYFLEGKNEVYIKDIHFSADSKETVFVISAPIKDDASGEMMGISVAKYKTGKFYSIVGGENGLGDTEENFLINKDKYFLTPSRFLGDSVILTNKVETRNSEECFSQQEVEEIKSHGYSNLNNHLDHLPFVEAKDYRNVDIIGTHFYIPETSWCLITEVDAEEIFKIREKVVTILWVILILAAILFLVVSYYLSKKITQPIEELKKEAEIVGKGRLDFDMRIKTRDEVGQLSESFEKMVRSLKEARLETEQKISQQTEELSQQKNELEIRQKAILNILEDVEVEKNLSEGLAKDLEKFKLAVDNTSNHIVITDSEGLALYANHAVEEITGFKISEVLGKKAGNKELWGGLMEKSLYEKMWQVIKTDKKTFIGELNNRRKNGEDYVALASISPVLDQSGQVTFFVGIERDITKEKQIDKAKTEFVSLASHQLRTPLSAINWYAEMLLAGDAGKINKKQKNFLDEIYDGNQRMVKLVNSLLNVSRIELGTLAVDPQLIDFSKVADSVLEELKKQIIEKKLKIENKYDKAVPEIKADVNIIRIVFQNLLTNAVKYTPEKGKISLSLEKDAESVLIKVSDTGYGIPKNQQDRIFEKMFRADNIKERDASGTGLGLYLVKTIIEDAKGRIWFTSEENIGTTFFITLPLSGMKKKEGSKTLSEEKI